MYLTLLVRVGGTGDNTLVGLWTGSNWKLISSPSDGFLNGVSAGDYHRPDRAILPRRGSPGSLEEPRHEE
jgi:hypothetical protein